MFLRETKRFIVSVVFIRLIDHTDAVRRKKIEKKGLFMYARILSVARSNKAAIIEAKFWPKGM